MALTQRKRMHLLNGVLHNLAFAAGTHLQRWPQMSGARGRCSTSIQTAPCPAKLTFAEPPHRHLDVLINSSSLIKALLCFICITLGQGDQNSFSPLSSWCKPWCSGRAAPAPDAEGVGGWSCAGKAHKSSRIYSRQAHAADYLISLSLSPAAL